MKIQHVKIKVKDLTDGYMENEETKYVDKTGIPPPLKSSGLPALRHL